MSNFEFPTPKKGVVSRFVEACMTACWYIFILKVFAEFIQWVLS